MILVILESPFHGLPIEKSRNIEYARECMLDCLTRGEAPFASHLLYTQCLDDTRGHERLMGIEAGLAWGAKADKTVVYLDRGISPGMQIGIERAESEGRKVEYRRIRAET